MAKPQKATQPKKQWKRTCTVQRCKPYFWTPPPPAARPSNGAHRLPHMPRSLSLQYPIPSVCFCFFPRILHAHGKRSARSILTLKQRLKQRHKATHPLVNPAQYTCPNPDDPEMCLNHTASPPRLLQPNNGHPYAYSKNPSYYRRSNTPHAFLLPTAFPFPALSLFLSTQYRCKTIHACMHESLSLTHTYTLHCMCHTHTHHPIQSPKCPCSRKIKIPPSQRLSRSSRVN